MSKISDLGRNLRFNVVGLGAVISEAAYMFMTNLGKFLVQSAIYVGFLFSSLFSSVSSLLKNNRYTILDGIIGLAVAFVCTFIAALFLFTVTGNPLGWSNFLWLWLAFSLAVPVWFFLLERKKV